MDNKQNFLHNLRHSTSHLLAAAILELYPKAKRTIGPPTESGFYYDFDFGDEKISEDDFPKIEQKMHEIAKTWKDMRSWKITKEKAEEFFKHNSYKLELIEELSQKNQELTFYSSGNAAKNLETWFTDLCKGGHVEHPDKELKYFKLLSIAGAYWRGSEKNKMLTRIYGTAFPTKEELEQYLEMLEEAKKRDHRKLGKELDLFVFSDLVGAGLPLFTPKGTILRNQLFAFSESLQEKYGYQKVWIPHITKIDLYQQSGHWDKFGDELFLVKSQETSDQFVMKPMNCPHHIQIYASRTRSYRDLPIRYMETTTQYRDEKAGEMMGLARVRSITIDDAHIFVRPDQIEEEFENIMNMIKEMYGALGMKFKARLSFRNEEDKYLGDRKDWENAQQVIENVAKKLGLDYHIETGEAAFYGPKIDIMVVDSLGRQWQCATEQLDFVQPVRFGITYTDTDGTQKIPFMIHKALLGSIERFLAVYIEHTAGKFPLWLSPVQIALLPIADRHLEAAKTIASHLKSEGIRVELYDRQDRLPAKIRDATLQRTPFMGIIGDKEIEDTDNLKLSVRTREGKDEGQLNLHTFIKDLKENIDKKIS